LRDQVKELIDEISGRYTIAFVTHSTQQAAGVSDYTIFMCLRRLIEYDITSRISTHPGEKMTGDCVTGGYG